MMVQIAGLSSALNISCEKFATSSEISEKYVFELANESIDCSTLKGCECSVERHLLQKKEINDCTPELTTLYINPNDNLPHVTNSFNSVILIREDLKCSSEMEISHADHADVLDFTEINEYYKRNNDFISSREDFKDIFPEGKYLHFF